MEVVLCDTKIITNFVDYNTNINMAENMEMPKQFDNLNSKVIGKKNSA